MRGFLARHPRVTTLFKLALAGAFTLLLVEGGLRVAGVSTLSARRTPPRDPRDLHELPFIATAQQRGWIPWPRTIKRIDPVPEHPRHFIEMVRNEASCREDDPTPLDKPRETLRIMSLGDSHTDGTGFNSESFVNRVEQQARRFPAGPRIDGINAGFGPSSPYQQLWAYEQVYRRFQPDELFVVYYAGNDLLELLREDDRVHLAEHDGQLVHAEPTAAPDVTRTTHLRWERGRQFFRDHSALYAALTDVPALRRLVRGTVHDAYRERLETAMHEHPAPVWQGLNQAYLFKHQADRLPAATRRLRFVIERFRDLTRADNCRLTLLILPTLRQIQPDLDPGGLQDSIRTLELNPDELLMDERSCDLACEVASELGVDFIDLRKPFRAAVQADRARPLYFRFDHHLNLWGQLEIANVLAPRWFTGDAARIQSDAD